MINLLPPDRKQAYTYAHRNTKLLSWVIYFSGAIIGLLLISSLGVLYVYQSSKSYDKQVQSLEQSLSSSNLPGIEKQTTDISNNLKLVVTVLSKEVLFSQLLKQLATITPSNATLKDVSINQAQSGMDITAATTDYNAATQLQVNLEDPNNKIFSKADIVSISCGVKGTSGEVASKYPCQVMIRAQFVKDNPFLFINSKGVKK